MRRVLGGLLACSAIKTVPLLSPAARIDSAVIEDDAETAGRSSARNGRRVEDEDDDDEEIEVETETAVAAAAGGSVSGPPRGERGSFCFTLSNVGGAVAVPFSPLVGVVANAAFDVEKEGGGVFSPSASPPEGRRIGSVMASAVVDCCCSCSDGC